MIVIRCTQRLLKSSPIAAATDPPPSASPLGEWYANAIPLPFPGRWLTLYVHAGTLLAVVAPGRSLGGTLQAFRLRLPSLLVRLNVPEPWIQARRAELADVVVARTASRRILGVMTDMRRLLLFDAEDAGSFAAMDLDRMEDFLAETPFHFAPGKMHSPEDVVRSLAASHVDAHS
jgi:hypothetical protein